MTIQELREKLVGDEAWLQNICERDSTEETNAELDKCLAEIDGIKKRLSALEDVEDGEVVGQQNSYRHADHPAVLRNRMYAEGKSTRKSKTYIAGSNDRFSIKRALKSLCEGTGLQGIEADFQHGKQTRANGFNVPFTRANEVYSGGTGAGLVTYDQADFISLLRKASIIEPLGLKTVMAGPGVYRLPRETSNSQASWVLEGNSITNSPLAVDYIEVHPLQLMAMVTLSRTLVYSSSYDSEMIVEQDIIQAVAEKLSGAIVTGLGVGAEPLGVINNPAVEMEALATPPTFTWGDALTMERKVLEANAPQGSAVKVLTSPFGAKRLKESPVLGTTFPSWIMQDNKVAGYDVVVSNHVPSNLSYSGTSALTTMAMGCFSEAVNVVLWASPQILIDPYSLGDSNNIRVICYMFCNVLTRRPSLLKTAVFK
jgi:HK97 family phage major capsid protein